MVTSHCDIPEKQQYIAALRAIGNRITDTQRQLLSAHCNAPNHSTTATNLARAIGAGSYRSVNSHYGRLGTLLRHALDFHVKGQQSYVIAWFERPGATQVSEWVWHMHPALAEALIDLGWAIPH